MVESRKTLILVLSMIAWVWADVWTDDQNCVKLFNSIYYKSSNISQFTGLQIRDFYYDQSSGNSTYLVQYHDPGSLNNEHHVVTEVDKNGDNVWSKDYNSSSNVKYIKSMMHSSLHQTLYLVGTSSSDNFTVIQLNTTNGDEIASYETSISCQNVTCSMLSYGDVFFCFVGQDNGDSTISNTHVVRFIMSNGNIQAYNLTDSSVEFKYSFIEILVLSLSEVYYYYAHPTLDIKFYRFK